MGDRFLSALERFEPTIAASVATNLYDRHILPVFVGNKA
jgi:hypothetical protein